MSATTATNTNAYQESSFDTDSHVDETGHSYLPFHPQAFGFPFQFSHSSLTHAGSMAAAQASQLLAGMMANPIDLAINVGTGFGKAVAGSALSGTTGLERGSRHQHQQPYDGMTRDWGHVDPAELSIDRRESGESSMTTLNSAGMDDEDEPSSSSRSVSPELLSNLATGNARRPSVRIDTDVMDVRDSPSMRPMVEDELVLSPVPAKRTTRRKSSAVVSGRSEGDEDKPTGKNKKTKPPTAKRGSTTSTTSNAPPDHPDSAFQIIDPPHPFSFKDLGLVPPPPFHPSEHAEQGSGEDDEDDVGKVGPDGVIIVKGKRREMNRVAAKRHREKNKDRLRSLEKRKVWLDHAVDEYEKSNKRLSETLERLKRENAMLKGVEVAA